MVANVAPLKVVQNADGTGYIAEMTAQDTIALQNLVAALRLLGGLTPTAGRIPIFTGDNAASVVALSAAGAFFDCIPKIGGDGVLEIGNMLDFHNTSGETADFYIRLYPDSNRNIFKVPGNNTGQNLMLFDQGNALGPVAFNGSVPTGRIVENVVNGNGRAVKFIDGTMWCFGPLGNRATVNTQAGSAGYHVGMGTFNYPVAFVGNKPAYFPYVVDPQSYYGGALYDSAGSTTTTPNTYLWSPANSFSAALSYFAVGRWTT